ncbi:hypothetical protein [Algihabitans albus]|uniref:hypothetical protein n=1 Tax=Algihabitans albus TaxID=2164067 RepID=UPI000E5CDF6C|nr:hypothetical protein [Algihabitans albus]
MEVLLALEATEVATVLRSSRWLYPLVNAGHILGLALLVGAIVPLDLRRLGFWRAAPVEALERVLSQTAVAGLCLAILTGALLFAVSATDYASLDLFLIKMALVSLAVANAVLARQRVLARRRTAPFAAVSLCLWLTVLGLGRLIGYQL